MFNCIYIGTQQTLVIMRTIIHWKIANRKNRGRTLSFGSRAVRPRVRILMMTGTDVILCFMYGRRWVEKVAENFSNIHTHGGSEWYYGTQNAIFFINQTAGGKSRLWCSLKLGSSEQWFFIPYIEVADGLTANCGQLTLEEEGKYKQ